ncbi:hypothetical protein ACFFX0_18590 [Citricoccus parietis]|uniref:Uncharacterized protein n=1 Tax=Citricoccus parietis TaxID=592307 RepID=A0ABV5G2E3_9MICC
MELSRRAALDVHPRVQAPQHRVTQPLAFTQHGARQHPLPRMAALVPLPQDHVQFPVGHGQEHDVGRHGRAGIGQQVIAFRRHASQSIQPGGGARVRRRERQRHGRTPRPCGRWCPRSSGRPPPVPA